MAINIGVQNLWLLYVLAYAIALPVQTWANRKRGQPIDDPEFLFHSKATFPLAMLWLFGGLGISLFVPLVFGVLFIFGLCFYIGGMVITCLTYYSFARHPGLVMSGIHRYSRNPGYVGWVLVIFGLTLMGWSASLGSILFLIYFILTLLYLHWTVLLEEDFLVNKYGESYKQYLKDTARYLGTPRR